MRFNKNQQLNFAGVYLRHGQPDMFPECISQRLAFVLTQRHLQHPSRLQYKHVMLKPASSTGHRCAVMAPPFVGEQEARHEQMVK